MFDTYYLLKKVGEDWYDATTPFMGISSTVNNIAENEKIILGKQYNLKFSFLVQNSKRQYGLPNGRYKLRIYSNSTDKDLKYQLRYKEVEFEINDGEWQMKKSNKSLIICIFVIIILIIGGYFGYKLGTEDRGEK